MFGGPQSRSFRISEPDQNLWRYNILNMQIMLTNSPIVLQHLTTYIQPFLASTILLQGVFLSNPLGFLAPLQVTAIRQWCHAAVKSQRFEPVFELFSPLFEPAFVLATSQDGIYRVLDLWKSSDSACKCYKVTGLLQFFIAPPVLRQLVPQKSPSNGTYPSKCSQVLGELQEIHEKTTAFHRFIHDQPIV